MQGENDLTFVAMPALQPPDIQMDQAQMAAAEKELAEAQSAQLPDDEDEDL